MGPDGIYPLVLKELACVIVRPLWIISERSLQSMKVPEDWKKADVILIFRKGKKGDWETTGQ